MPTPGPYATEFVAAADKTCADGNRSTRPVAARIARQIKSVNAADGTSSTSDVAESYDRAADIAEQTSDDMAEIEAPGARRVRWQRYQALTAQNVALVRVRGVAAQVQTNAVSPSLDALQLAVDRERRRLARDLDLKVCGKRLTD